MGNVCPSLALLMGRKLPSTVDSDPLLEISPVPDREGAKLVAEPELAKAAGAGAVTVRQPGGALRAPSTMYASFVRDMVPDLAGQVAIVTGANAGIGFWAARALAAKGATVVLACRDLSKAAAAKAEIERALRDEAGLQAHVEVSHLDLASFASVRAFAVDFRARHDRLDMLLNNAGIMGVARSLTVDGWDVQLQTNHLSHFLLTRELFDMLARAPGGGRAVHHSSMAHKAGTPRINCEALNEGAMDGMCGLAGRLPGAAPFVRYAQSKLANVLFAFELDRRLIAAGLQGKVKSVCAHPGVADTHLFDAPTRTGSIPSFFRCFAPHMQSAEDGALPLLLAATHGDVKSGGFYGPQHEFRGHPVRCKSGGHAQDARMARELWVLSELATGCRFLPGDVHAPVPAGHPAGVAHENAPPAADVQRG
ncbi:hypothetical protein KFE25_009099 [Diacronema lutheri]|uniref:Protochlorophyllide reductase n=2 Tax=Diacronema lutheri TaxID=2081491 RepID=A0A8J6CK48_DIALT|nr:hypothetical protein KFE25_009099 [Diacronema lutheri]